MTHSSDTAVSTFEAKRNRLFGLAYRMLGSRAEAEDVVQETYVRWHQTERASIDNAEAWLVTTATRLAIDRLRRLRTEREAYRGPWLPEPILATAPPPDQHLDLADDLSIAFVTVLERLAPDERAAFLLHDVFDVGYGEIASILSKTEAACRQIVHRARTRVRDTRKRFDAPESAKAHLLQRFTAAIDARDEKALLELFTPDATWTADGGGKTAASPQPLVGAEQIVRLVLGLRRNYWTDDRVMELASVNGETGLLIRDGHQLRSVLTIDTDGARIANVYAVVNPDKLAGAQRDN